MYTAVYGDANPPVNFPFSVHELDWLQAVIPMRRTTKRMGVAGSHLQSPSMQFQNQLMLQTIGQGRGIANMMEQMLMPFLTRLFAGTPPPQTMPASTTHFIEELPIGDQPTSPMSQQSSPASQRSANMSLVPLPPSVGMNAPATNTADAVEPKSATDASKAVLKALHSRKIMKKPAAKAKAAAKGKAAAKSKAGVNKLQASQLRSAMRKAGRSSTHGQDSLGRSSTRL
jgi:hypothetical protein